MPRIAHQLRRSVGVAVAGCVAATGLLLAVPTAAQASVKQPQTLTFPAIADQLLSTGHIGLAASAPSGDWIDYEIADQSVCSTPIYARRPVGAVRPAMSTNTILLTFHKVGTCTITAQQPGNAEWLPSDKVTRSFQIVETFAKPRLSLKVPAGVALSKHTASFSTSSTSGVAARSIAVSSATASVCAVASSTVVKLAKAGTCTLTATGPGAASVTRSFPVWGTPEIPAKGRTTQTVALLGRGESDLRVAAKPAKVCRANDGEVTLVAPGACRVRVSDGPRAVRAGTIKVAFVKTANPARQLERAGSVRFAFNSAVLTPAAKKALHRDLRTLRKARTVIVYGNTFGPGKNSSHSRRLAADRAAAVVGYLKVHGIKAKAVTVAAAMQNPVSKDPAKNRRADIYYQR